jgi:hypothetical protein
MPEDYEDATDGCAGGDALQASTAGNNGHGVPVPGYPRLRAGVPGGNGLLGLQRLGGDTVGAAGFDDSAIGRLVSPYLMLAANRSSVGTPSGQAGGDPYPMPRAYMPDGKGGVQLTPGFAATHPKGPDDFSGMGKEIDWPGVALDLGSIAASSLPLIGGGAKDIVKAIPGWGLETWKELHHGQRPKKAGSD